MVTFSKHNFSVDLMLSLLDLGEMNKEETGIGWDLNVSLYDMLSLDPTIFTVNDEDIVVGFSSVIVGNHHRYSKNVGIVDTVYILPEYRKGFTGVKLLKFIEESLKEDDVQGIFISSSEKRDISKLLDRIGYSRVETTYFKEIG